MKLRRLIVWFMNSPSTCNGFRFEYPGAVAQQYPNLNGRLSIRPVPASGTK
jgi:hypothetical protein